MFLSRVLSGALIVLAVGCASGNCSVGAGLPPEEIARVLDAHNRLRCEVGVGPLAWSAALAEFAEAWALRLAADGGEIRHRPREGDWAQRHGENLFAGTVGHFSPAQAVEIWAEERSRYRGEAISWSNSPAFGHYTQIVWHGTARVGCGVAEGGGMLIVVCNYDPQGNIVGQRPY